MKSKLIELWNKFDEFLGKLATLIVIVLLFYWFINMWYQQRVDIVKEGLKQYNQEQSK